MHVFSSIILSTLCAVASTVNAADTNYFINPPTPGAIHQYTDNNVYVEGATLDLQWTTDYPTITLYFWQNDNDTAQVLIEDQHTDQQLSYKLDLTGTYDLKSGNVFFFQIFNGTSDTSFSSHYFNITAASSPAASQTTYAATSSATSAPATSSAVPAAASASQTPTNSASADNSDSGLSSGAKAGIGVGVAVGVIGLIAAAIAAFFLLRRRRGGNYSPAHSSPDQGMQQQQYESYQQPPGTSSPAPGYSPSPGYIAVPNGFSSDGKPVEMATQQAPSELPAHQTTHHELMAQSPTRYR